MSLDLFDLLPAVYRIRDIEYAQSRSLLTLSESAELAALQAIALPSPDEQARLDELLSKASRGPLQSLLMVIQEQLAIVAEDLDQLYDDHFIETCAQWVIPYIGDLIGYESVKGIAPAIDNPRAEVANTISLRRRKGTVLVMEQLARDATGWGAHAVELFQVLADTQYMNHVRPWNYYAPDLRDWRAGLYMDTGFDRTAHKVDVRRIAVNRGRYNIPNIGIFLWSLNAYSITRAPAAGVVSAPGCFRFSSLDTDVPLFHRAIPQGEEITDPARPFNVADTLRRRVLCSDLRKGVGARYYGETNSLALYLDGNLVNPYQIEVATLAGADGSWANLPGGNSPFEVVVDPELGRLALPAPPPGKSLPKLEVAYYYGFNADMGGGEYPRGNTFLVTDPAFVFPFPDTAALPRYATLQDAVNFAISQFAQTGEVAIEVTNSDTYPQTGTLSLNVDLPAGTTLELRAADQTRPTLLLDGEISVTGADSSTFAINGLLIAASAAMAPGSPAPVALVHVPQLAPDGSPNSLGELDLTHCTLVPGWSVGPQGAPNFPAQPAVVAEPAGLNVVAERSVLGAVRAGRLVVASGTDCIIDATDRTQVAYAALDGFSGGGALTLVGCTVVGKVHATLLTLVSDSIFWAGLIAHDPWTTQTGDPTALIADRKQEGCVRFSFVPEGARTPRRYECVEQRIAGPQPIFYALRYGLPGYLKLLPDTPDVIRRGADDEGEMGAFHFVLGPLREADLRVRMQEYLPVGLEFGISYQN
jgi:hypothetical protein